MGKSEAVGERFGGGRGGCINLLNGDESREEEEKKENETSSVNKANAVHHKRD